MEAWAQGGGRNHRGWAGAFNETTAKRHPFATFGFPRTYADELLKLPRYTPYPRMPASAYTSWGVRPAGSASAATSWRPPISVNCA